MGQRGCGHAGFEMPTGPPSGHIPRVADTQVRNSVGRSQRVWREGSWGRSPLVKVLPSDAQTSPESSLCFPLHGTAFSLHVVAEAGKPSWPLRSLDHSSSNSKKVGSSYLRLLARPFFLNGPHPYPRTTLQDLQEAVQAAVPQGPIVCSSQNPLVPIHDSGQQDLSP